MTQDNTYQLDSTAAASSPSWRRKRKAACLERTATPTQPFSCRAVLLCPAAELLNFTGSERSGGKPDFESTTTARPRNSCSLQLQLSSLPASQPSWKDPPAQLVWKHELGGALCRADLPVMSQNQHENIGTNWPLSVSACYILHRTLL